MTQNRPTNPTTADPAIDPASGQNPDLPVNLVTVAGLPTRKARNFDLRPDAAGRHAMAATLGIEAITALKLDGQIKAEGRNDFRLTATLSARVLQACVITLESVPAQIDETIDRLYQAALEHPTDEEIEIPDEDVEPLPLAIDLTAIALEALSLGLPLYPRAPGAALGAAVFAEPGVKALTDEDLKPFAGLAGLAAKLKQGAPDA